MGTAFIILQCILFLLLILVVPICVAVDSKKMSLTILVSWWLFIFAYALDALVLGPWVPTFAPWLHGHFCDGPVVVGAAFSGPIWALLVWWIAKPIRYVWTQWVPPKLHTMAHWSAIIVAWLAVLIVLGGMALPHQRDTFLRKWEDQRLTTAMTNFGGNLPEVDEVRLMRLAPVSAFLSGGTYHLNLRKLPEMSIAVERTLAGSEARDFAGLWRSIQLTPGSWSENFEPEYVFQFRSPEQPLGDILLSVSNATADVPVWAAPGQVAIRNATSPEFQKLRAILQQRLSTQTP